MPIVTVNEWIPDAAALGNPGSPVVTNAIPAVNSYQPMPQHVALTNSLSSYARGAILGKDKDDNVFNYAGDATALYSLTSTTWSDVSIMGGYSTGTDSTWDMVRWRQQILATNWNDNIQEITFGGANFADLTTALRCRALGVIKDWVIFANTWDGVDGNQPDRVRTSAFNDPSTVTVDDTVGAISRNLNGSAILKVFGGEFAVLLTKDACYRMDFEGAPTWFRIDPTLPGVGTLGQKAAARIGNTIFTASENGFIAVVNGSGEVPIGAGKVDKFFAADLDDDYLYRISCVADARQGRIWWAYPGAGNTSGRPNKLLVYDRNLNKWGYAEVEVDMIWTAGGVGFTLDALDAVSGSLDALTPSLDSSQWKGDGAKLLAAFDSSSAHGYFDGSPMTATVELKEQEINAGHVTHLNEFTPLVSGGTVTARVGHRNRQSDNVTYTASLSQTSSGRIKSRKGARFHRVELTCSGAWEDVIGVEIDGVGARRMERRG